MAENITIDLNKWGIPPNMRRGIIIGVIIFAAILILLGPLAPWTVVKPGHRGVIVQLGAVKPHVLGEGIHFRIPLMQKIEQVEVRVQKVETEADAASKDLQNVHSTIAVNFHVSPDDAALIFQRIGRDFQSKMIDPAVQESVKAATANYTAEELITKRQVVSTKIRELLTIRLKEFYIAVDGFSVVNFRFSEEFNRAIESKQTAEQLALKARRDLERVRIEAEQKIAHAKAEAEALRLQKQNVTPELLRLREIEAKLKAIEKWDGKMPNVNSGAIPFLDITDNK